MRRWALFFLWPLSSWAQSNGGENWTFNPIAVKRDPFIAPEAKAERELNELQQFDLNEMNLVAILTGMGSPQAMVVLPNGKTHIVQKGDSIGRHNGRIHRIKSDEVVVTESFRDFKGRTKKSFTSLVIAN